jgi:hypothetical protein
MSWTAKRYKVKDYHHVPPRHPATATPFKMRVRKVDHAAYHQLFANAASFEQCVEILWRDWWHPYHQARLPCNDASRKTSMPN